MTLPKKAGKTSAKDVGGCLKEYAVPKAGEDSFRQTRERAWEESAREKTLKTAMEKRLGE